MNIFASIYAITFHCIDHFRYFCMSLSCFANLSISSVWTEIICSFDNCFFLPCCLLFTVLYVDWLYSLLLLLLLLFQTSINPISSPPITSLASMPCYSKLLPNSNKSMCYYLVNCEKSFSYFYLFITINNYQRLVLLRV